MAGVCGRPGHVDGVYTANKLNRPEVVGVDAQGYLFIYDAGNEVVRMVDLDGVMHTLIDGACRRDKTMPTPDIPFDLELRGMVCYKRWSRAIPLTDGNEDPYAEETEEPAASEEGDNEEAGDGEEEEEAEDDAGEGDDEGDAEGLISDHYRVTCREIHPILCEERERHPFVRERGPGMFYLD